MTTNHCSPTLGNLSHNHSFHYSFFHMIDDHRSSCTGDSVKSVRVKVSKTTNVWYLTMLALKPSEVHQPWEMVDKGNF